MGGCGGERCREVTDYVSKCCSRRWRWLMAVLMMEVVAEKDDWARSGAIVAFTSVLEVALTSWWLIVFVPVK